MPPQTMGNVPQTRPQELKGGYVTSAERQILLPQVVFTG